MIEPTDWTTDVLGAPYEACRLVLEPDVDGAPIEAVLVRRTAGNRKAVLHVHGFADYFFQTAYAEHWLAKGYDFYALDLRRYGRALLEGQYANYTDDLAEYYEELDLAHAEVMREHDHVVLSAHSTGGLTVPLWVQDRKIDAAGIVLNAPWLDMHGDTVTRLLAMPVIHQLGNYQPLREVPRRVSGIYAQSLHKEHHGEWDFNLDWKPIKSWPVYAGWLRAIRTGHSRVSEGLDLTAPILVICSAASSQPTTMDDPAATTTDIVLDVRQIQRRASALGRHVTLAMVQGVVHDVFLSAAGPRGRAYAELDTFLDAYVDRWSS